MLSIADFMFYILMIFFFFTLCGSHLIYVDYNTLFLCGERVYFSIILDQYAGRVTTKLFPILGPIARQIKST